LSNSKRKILRRKAAKDDTGSHLHETTRTAEPPNNRVMLRPVFGRSTLCLPLTFLTNRLLLNLKLALPKP